MLIHPDVFSLDKKIAFDLPVSTDHARFINSIESLPDQENVTHYGLPANIDRTMQSNASQSIIS